MSFLVSVELELCPPSAFLGIADAKEKLVRDYGWKSAYTDGAAGKLYACEKRKVTFTLTGKEGANQAMAQRDVADALAGVGNGVRFWRWFDQAVSDGLRESATFAAQTAGQAAGTGLKGLGEGTGFGTLGVATFGSILLLGIVAVAVGVGIVALKRA